MNSLFAQFAVLAGLVYTVLEFLKPVYDHENHKWNFDKVAAIALGIGISLAAQFDLIDLAGVALAVPYVGQILTGILVGGSVGAGLIHDFPDFFKALFGKTQ